MLIKKFEKGFTLMEMLVVIAIIGILATVVVVGVNKSREKSRITRIQSDIQQMKLQLESDVEPPKLDYASIPDITGCTSPCVPTATAGSAYENLIADAEKNGVKDWSIVLGSKLYYVAAKEPNDLWYCVDSSGNTTERSTVPDNSIPCP